MVTDPPTFFVAFRVEPGPDRQARFGFRVADEVDDLFANRKPLVVQDPFDLIHNVGKGMVQNKLNRFVSFSRRSYEMLQHNLE